MVTTPESISKLLLAVMSVERGSVVLRKEPCSPPIFSSRGSAHHSSPRRHTCQKRVLHERFHFTARTHLQFHWVTEHTKRWEKCFGTDKICSELIQPPRQVKSLTLFAFKSNSMISPFCRNRSSGTDNAEGHTHTPNYRTDMMLLNCYFINSLQSGHLDLCLKLPQQGQDKRSVTMQSHMQTDL